MFFKHFASKNQLPSFYLSRTLVENGLNQVCSIIKQESANICKNWLMIWITRIYIEIPHNNYFWYLFDSLPIIVSRLAVKLVSLKSGGLYMPATGILFLRIVISIVRISMPEGFSIFMDRLGNWSLNWLLQRKNCISHEKGANSPMSLGIKVLWSLAVVPKETHDTYQNAIYSKFIRITSLLIWLINTNCKQIQIT